MFLWLKTRKASDQNNIDEILKLVYDKPFNFLFINTDTQTLFKNWDQILISENI